MGMRVAALASILALTTVATADGGSSLVLPIPARGQAKEAPPEGWCGETAIQEALLYYGVWVPQRIVNRAGKPAHPDLYSNEIPVALTALDVRYTVYAGPRGYEPFARWARDALDAGDPVLAGVKILPTQHPSWALDHFVLVVGYGAQGLLVNTTWGTRQWVFDTDGPGLSLKNAVYGIRLRGLASSKDATSARASVLEENARVVKLRVACPGTAAAPATAERTMERVVTVDADSQARFQCAALR
jgi:hypothetical protein